MVQGIAALNKKLMVTMPAKIEAATRKAMETGAQELVDMMKRLAPHQTGELRDSIGWAWNEAPVGATVVAESASDSRGLKIVVYAGDEVAYYAAWVEFGTNPRNKGEGKENKMPAHPFFFPAYRALRKRIKSRVTREMKKAIRAESANG